MGFWWVPQWVMRWVGSCMMGHAMGGVMCVKGHHMGGIMCVRGSLHGWGHVWGHPSDNGATHSGKGSTCSKLFVGQGFCGWPGRVKQKLEFFFLPLPSETMVWDHGLNPPSECTHNHGDPKVTGSRQAMSNMTGRPGRRKMEMHGGSSPSYLARTLASPCFDTTWMGPKVGQRWFLAESGCFRMGQSPSQSSGSSKPAQVRTYLHAQIRLPPSPLLWAPNRNQPTQTPHPLMKDTPGEDLLAVTGANSGRFELGSCQAGMAWKTAESQKWEKWKNLKTAASWTGGENVAKNWPEDGENTENCLEYPLFGSFFAPVQLGAVFHFGFPFFPHFRHLAVFRAICHTSPAWYQGLKLADPEQQYM